MPQQRAWGNMQWNLNKRDVVCSGNEKPHKCLETFSHKTGYTNVFENLEAQSYSSPNGQHGSFEFKISSISKKYMGSSSPVWGHSYCKVPSQQTERDSRLGVKKQFGLPVISENLSTEGNTRDNCL